MGRAVLTRVALLDGTNLDLHIDPKATGRDVLDKVCEHLDLLERDYFGLVIGRGRNPRIWLDLDKRISKYLKSDLLELSFQVKFYPPEPASMQEDLTRYHLYQQIRNDIASGHLPCSFVALALLCSYTVQSELGDYDVEEMGKDYTRNFQFVPNQTPDLEEKIMELHKTHKGLTPSDAELNYLENAKKLSLYGVDFHSVKDSEGIDIAIDVSSAGISVYRDKLRINRFAWPKIVKISFKRRNFYVKMRPSEFDRFEMTVAFKLSDCRSAKLLWKACVEQHSFFRLMTSRPLKKTTFPRFGSRFRYSGKTQHESKADVIERAPPQFQRTPSVSKSVEALNLDEKQMDYLMSQSSERIYVVAPSAKPDAKSFFKPSKRSKSSKKEYEKLPSK